MTTTAHASTRAGTADPARVDHALGLLGRTERRRLRRSALVTTLLALTSLAVAVLNLTVGDFPLAPLDVARTLVGQGDDTTALVLREFRGPRLVLGLLVGIAFALSGALFQSVLRNPLASPDVIGVTQGASVGAVLGLLVLDLDALAVAGAAMAGAATVTLLNLVIAWNGGVRGQRFVLCGIGLSFACSSVLGYLLTRSDTRDAQAALVWLSGSVANATWEGNARLGLALLVLVPLALAQSGPLRMLALGDETAAALGVGATRARLVALVLGVALAGLATAAAGPVVFVALASAPIARRLVGDGRAALVPTAMVGVTLVTACDFAAQHLLERQQIPVGLLTGVVGGGYLIWLLATSRATSGGTR